MTNVINHKDYHKNLRLVSEHVDDKLNQEDTWYKYFRKGNTEYLTNY